MFKQIDKKIIVSFIVCITSFIFAFVFLSFKIYILTFIFFIIGAYTLFDLKNYGDKINSNLNIDVDVDISTNYVNVDIKQKTKGTLSCLKLNGFKSLSNGYLNYCNYRIVGVNSKTNRKKTIHIDAINENNAIESAKKQGLIEPFDISIVPFENPTESQLAFAHKLCAKIPDDANKEDVRNIISRIVDEDEQSASEILGMFAHKNNLKFSLFIGRIALINLVYYNLSLRDRCALFSYCVYVTQLGGSAFDVFENKLCGTMGNIFSSEINEQFYKIADKLLEDKSVIESFEKREISDYFKPNKNTLIYKTCVKNLKALI